MNIDTKFNIGELIYTMDKDTLNVQTFKIDEISIRVNPKMHAEGDETDHDKDRFSNPNKRIHISFICDNKRIGYQEALTKEEVKIALSELLNNKLLKLDAECDIDV